MIGKFIVIVAVVILAAFFASDADLPLVLLPNPPVKSSAGQVVWIVGASSGIGASLALDYAKDGAKVVISSRRVSQLEELSKKCSEYGESPLVLPMDVTNYDEHISAFNKIIETFGHIDVLVLNAGVSQRNLAIDTDFAVTESIMKLNFLSYVALNKIVLPHFVERNQGKIVVMSSLSGIIGTPVGSSYSASKFALHGYFNALRSEVSVNNIGVSIVCPGPVVSEISDKAFRNPNLPKEKTESRMSTERCTSLILKGVYYNFEEMWISQQPFLAMTYVSGYAPALARVLMKKYFGPARVNAMKSGKSLYDPQVALGLTK